MTVMCVSREWRQSQLLSQLTEESACGSATFLESPEDFEDMADAAASRGLLQRGVDDDHPVLETS